MKNGNLLALLMALSVCSASNAATPYQREAFGDGDVPDAAGWSFGSGGAVVQNSGEMLLGDNALLYSASSVTGNNGFHLFHPLGAATPNPVFVGNYSAAAVAGIQFRARHSGVGDSVVLRAVLFDSFANGLDWAQSAQPVTIANTATEWQTYNLSLMPGDLVAGGVNGLPVETILAGVVQIGLRHDPLGTGPGTPAAVAAPTAVNFDDITLFATNPSLPIGTFVGTGSVCSLGDAFGANKYAWQEWLFIAAPRECAFRDGSLVQDGVVYVYRQTGGRYVFTQRLTRTGNSTGGEGDRFGAGIVAGGGYLFVAAANDQAFAGFVDPREGSIPDSPPFSFAGKVHVYKLDTAEESWDFSQTLISPAPGTFGSFGARTQSRHIAMNAAANLAVIGEFNNFEESAGVLHVFRREENNWGLVQTIQTPAGVNNFADSIVALDDDYFVVSGEDSQPDTLTPKAFLYGPMGTGLAASPAQTLTFETVSGLNCFGLYAGIAAAKTTLAIAEPCGTTSAGANAGKVNVYSFDPANPTPLMLDQVIAGNASNGYLGANFFGSQEVVAVDDNGTRLAIGNPLFLTGAIAEEAHGNNVLLYEQTQNSGWLLTRQLTSPSTTLVPDFRMFGDALLFAGGQVLVSEYNANVDPNLARGAVHIYDSDTDGDGAFNSVDNCLEAENPDQRDTDGDGIGNVCDPDLNNDCQVNLLDLAAFRSVFLTDDPDADFDGGGTVDLLDLAIVRTFFLRPPGPSATGCTPVR